MPGPGAGDVLQGFHPAVQRWFASCFAAPTACQSQAWPAIRAGRPALIAAPTGSGKTLAAFLAAIDDLVRRDLAGSLEDAVQVLYVSPLKALGNDIERNLQAPLAGIDAALGGGRLGIRTFVRSGDTPQPARAAMRRRVPHVLVTTPESLYLLVTSDSGRAALGAVRTVIVDEIHAVAGNKRGAHLALSLARLDALGARPPVRIGLSATQRPLQSIAAFLTGVDEHGEPQPCTVVDGGHARRRDLALELPEAPLETVMSAEVWESVYDRLAALVNAHRTTLVFVNTRRLAERLARHLSERLGTARVGAHHGSMARAQRLGAEQRLKAGELSVLVATASLELGIDIGEVDLVCQLGSTRAIATFLQRVGRSGHGVDRVPKGRLFPLSRDELVECVALLEAVHAGELESVSIPEAPLDVLAQQIVAAVACQEWDEHALYRLVRRAWPYRELARERFDAVLHMLAEGYSARRGRAGAYLHRDRVNDRLRARRGARLTALTCGGTIPDAAEYDVRQEPGDTFVGKVDEDFAIESMPGEIFQLGNTAWRILRVETNAVRVADARGQPPTIPFWFGEAPARSDELSAAVARLRADLDRALALAPAAAHERLRAIPGVVEAAAVQLVDYLAAARAPFAALPTAETLIMERFFDESGGMQLVIHSPLGGRVNRAWGLALRKRFCRSFNFELQAAATEDAIVLSLGATHSFVLDEVWRYLEPRSVRTVLVQALLDAPLFAVRWRWNAACALAVPRFSAGRRVPPRLQRMRAEDFAAVVFPDSRACFENIRGEREIPDHPLVRQTLHDCLTEAMDIAGLERLLGAMRAGRVRLIAHDLTEPSPLARAILAARPYAFLDDAPLEERRTLAVQGRRWLDADTAADLGRLDAEAIARVRAEAWPEASSADELHDALCLLGFMTEAEGEASGWGAWFEILIAAGRAARCEPVAGGAPLWVAAERLALLAAVVPQARLRPALRAPASCAAHPWTGAGALVELSRGRLEALGPVTAAALAAPLHLESATMAAALAALETEGFVLRGQFDPGAGEQWCERRLLARIHRHTVQRLRREIEPVATTDFLRFLCRWQHAVPATRLQGTQALAAVLEQLQGFAVPAVAWEGDILPLRLRDYAPSHLDEACLSGRWHWLRADVPRATPLRGRVPAPVKSTPIAFFARRAAAAWSRADAAAVNPGLPGSAAARAVQAWIEQHGASFFEDIVDGSGLLATQIEAALGELVARGRVRCDSFMGLRALIAPSNRRRARRAARFAPGIDAAGRWALCGPEHAACEPGEATEQVARDLLRRYGVVFRRLLEREAPLPPWRDLLRVYRRLEARGEIRGGRFVAGHGGEQYALPEALAALRTVRREPGGGELVAVCGADPLNLVGILTPGPRLPALAGSRLVYRDGEPVALRAGGRVQLLAAAEPAIEWAIRTALARAPGVRGAHSALGRTA